MPLTKGTALPLDDRAVHENVGQGGAVEVAAQTVRMAGAVERHPAALGRVRRIGDIHGKVACGGADVTGRVDAFSVDRSILNGYVDDSTMLLDAQFAPQEYGVATKKSNTQLADQIDAAIGAMSDDGTLRSLQERWGLVDDAPAGDGKDGGQDA